jgi:hypothetical protein
MNSTQFQWMSFRKKRIFTSSLLRREEFPVQRIMNFRLQVEEEQGQEKTRLLGG